MANYSNSYFETRGVSPKRSGTRDDRITEASFGGYNSGYRGEDAVTNVDFGVYKAPPAAVRNDYSYHYSSLPTIPYYSNIVSTISVNGPPPNPIMAAPLSQPSAHYQNHYATSAAATARYDEYNSFQGIGGSRYPPGLNTSTPPVETPMAVAYNTAAEPEVSVVHHHYYGSGPVEAEVRHHPFVVHNHMYGSSALPQPAQSTLPLTSAARAQPVNSPQYLLAYGAGTERAQDHSTGLGDLYIAGKSRYVPVAEPTPAIGSNNSYRQAHSHETHFGPFPTAPPSPYIAYTSGTQTSPLYPPASYSPSVHDQASSPMFPVSPHHRSHQTLDRQLSVPPQIVHNRLAIHDQFNRSMEVMQSELRGAHIRSLLVVLQDDEAKVRALILAEENREVATLANYSNTLSEVLHSYQLQLQHRKNQQQLDDEMADQAEDLLRAHYAKQLRGERHRQHVVEDISRDREDVRERGSQSRTPQRRRAASIAAMQQQEEFMRLEREREYREPSRQNHRENLSYEDYMLELSRQSPRSSLQKRTAHVTPHKNKNSEHSIGSALRQLGGSSYDHLSPFQGRAAIHGSLAHTARNKSPAQDVLDYRPASAIRRRENRPTSPNRSVSFADQY